MCWFLIKSISKLRLPDIITHVWSHLSAYERKLKIGEIGHKTFSIFRCHSPILNFSAMWILISGPLPDNANTSLSSEKKYKQSSKVDRGRGVHEITIFKIRKIEDKKFNFPAAFMLKIRQNSDHVHTCTCTSDRRYSQLAGFFEVTQPKNCSESCCVVCGWHQFCIFYLLLCKRVAFHW